MANEKTIATLEKWIVEVGLRQTAVKIIDNYFRRMGLSVHDLPDSMTFASGLDEIVSLLKAGHYVDAIQSGIETAKEMLEDEGFPGMFENKENKKIIMKRVKFKNELKDINEALTKVPNLLKEDKNVFEMTDGNKTFKVRWEGTLEEGKAVALTAKDETLINEDMSHMKHLMGYKSEDTIGTPKAKGRVMENDKFKELLSVSKKKL